MYCQWRFAECSIWQYFVTGTYWDIQQNQEYIENIHSFIYKLLSRVGSSAKFPFKSYVIIALRIDQSPWKVDYNNSESPKKLGEKYTHASFYQLCIQTTILLTCMKMENSKNKQFSLSMKWLWKGNNNWQYFLPDSEVQQANNHWRLLSVPTRNSPETTLF